MPSVHAMLGPSGSKKWLTCTPSALLESGVPDEGSEYAAEGIKAHDLAERKLKAWLKTGQLKKLKCDDPDMDRYTDQYRDYVLEVYTAEKKECPDAKLMIEQKLDYSNWVPGGFGTGDACIISDTCLHVIDLKYGKGVLVDAEDNPQLKLYAAGAIAKWANEFFFEKVVVHIYQPRKDNIVTDSFTVDEITDWMESFVKPRAELAAAGKGDFVAGCHCDDGFCRMRDACKAYHQWHLDQLEAFKNENGVLQRPGSITPAEAAAIFPQLKSIATWAQNLEKWCLEQALEGTVFPGLKLVAGRSVRKITDPEAVEKKLLEAGYTEQDIIKPREMISMTALEKLCGKAAFAKLSDGLIEKSPGKPTLVPESDKRKPLDMAMNDFADE